MEDTIIIHIVDYDGEHILCGKPALHAMNTDPISLVGPLGPNERYCSLCEKDPRIPLLLLDSVDL